MKSTINKDLLPLKIHYFFKYGGIAFFSFLSVVARQKGIPEVAVGLMWSVTPLSSCAINIFNSALADKFKIYRGMFLGAMVALTVSFLSFFLLPDIAPQTTFPDTSALLPLQCANLTTSSVALCSDRAPLDFLESFECAENVQKPGGGKKEKDLHCALECYPQEDGEGGDSMLNQTFLFKDVGLSFNTSESDHYHMCEEKSCTIITVSPAPPSSCTGQYTDVTCRYFCEVPPLTLVQLLKRVEFWLMFFLLLTIYGSNGTTTTMADTICFQLLGKDGRHLYGRQRMFGSIGWGIVATTGGALIDIFSHGKDHVTYIPVVVLAGFFLTCNLVASARVPFKVHDREKLRARNVGRAICSFTFLIYLLTVVVGGLNMGMVWTFVFILVEDIAGTSFTHIKLLQGIMMGVGIFLGEVPSLFLSAVVIKKLGSVVTFVISLTAMALRVFLYSAVRQPWLFVPIDLLHGLSFGLFYPNMIAFASHVSPPGAMATVQGIVKTTFIAGVSLGALTGGLLISSVGGSSAFFYVGVFDIVFTVIFALVQYLMYTRRVAAGKMKYHVPGEAELQEAVIIAEEQRSVIDVQVCTPGPELPELAGLCHPPDDHEGGK